MKGNYPANYWHCYVKLSTAKGARDYSVVNDMSFDELDSQIIQHWLHSKSFTISGKIVRSSKDVSEIKITQTDQTQDVYRDMHNSQMRASGIGDLANRWECKLFCVNGIST